MTSATRSLAQRSDFGPQRRSVGLVLPFSALWACKLTSRSSGRVQQRHPASPVSSCAAPLNSRSVRPHVGARASAHRVSIQALAQAWDTARSGDFHHATRLFDSREGGVPSDMGAWSNLRARGSRPRRSACRPGFAGGTRRQGVFCAPEVLRPSRGDRERDVGIWKSSGFATHQRSLDRIARSWPQYSGRSQQHPCLASTPPNCWSEGQQGHLRHVV